MNIYQTFSIVSAYNDVKRKVCSCVKLIQGHVRIGNDSMLITLIYVLLHLRCKVLVCVLTNTAMSEIAMKFLNIFPNPSDHFPNTCNFLYCEID